VAAYRIAVEAMTNVARHSGARNCRVSVERSGAFELEVSDDGEGVPARFRANVGLDSMRERAAELGGTCTIERGPSGGTRVRARIPMPEE
jgi:two-component system NarL family sensor kinase